MSNAPTDDFIDQAAVHLMPTAIGMSVKHVRSTVTGETEIKADLDGAGTLAYQMAHALHAARESHKEQHANTEDANKQIAEALSPKPAGKVKEQTVPGVNAPAADADAPPAPLPPVSAPEPAHIDAPAPAPFSPAK